MEYGSDWGGGWDHKDDFDDRTEEQAEEKDEKIDHTKEEKESYKEKEENHYDFFEEIKKDFEQREKEEDEEKQKQEVKEDLKIELEEEVKEELKEELREEVWKDLREELEEEVKKELKQEFEKQIKKELKTELKGQVKKELEDDLSGDVREEIKEKLTNDHAEIKRDLTELTKSFRNSEHCNDTAEKILNNLLQNDYPFQNRDSKEIVSALGYLGLVICNERFDKDEFSNLTNVPNEKIKDRVIEFYKYLDDDLLDNLFEKYEFISKNDEVSSEIRKLKEKMEKLKDKKRELVKENERLREILVKSKEEIEELTIGKKQIEVNEGDDESNDMQSKNEIEGENTDVARDVFLKNFETTKFPDDFFYKEGRTIRCKDVGVIKTIYEGCGSLYEIKIVLEKSDCKNVLSDSTIIKIIQASFESKESYQRWMKDHSKAFLSEEKRIEVLELVSREDHDSLAEIERITEVSRSAIREIAQRIYGDDYEKEFPRIDLSEEKRIEVLELVSREDHDSLNEVSKQTAVSPYTVIEIAQEVWGDDYEKEFPHYERLSEEKREEVIELLSKKDHGTLTEIERITGVSHTTALKIAQEIWGDDYEKEFPYKIPEEKREEVIELLSREGHETLTEIERITGVSWSTISRFAMEIYGDDYLKEFPMDFAAHKGKVVHSLTNDLATKSFDEKRRNDSNIPKYYSEIMIYQRKDGIRGCSKHPDGGFPNDTGYFEVLLTDELSRELMLNPTVSNRTKIVIFDHTNDLSDENVLNKIIKYQHAEIMFFIVGTNWYHDWVGRVRNLPNFSRVKYPNNIRVISVDLFADLIGLEGVHREKLGEIIRLNENNDLNALITIKENTNIKKHSTDELREVFKEVFSDENRSLDRWIKKKIPAN